MVSILRLGRRAHALGAGLMFLASRLAVAAVAPRLIARGGSATRLRNLSSSFAGRPSLSFALPKTPAPLATYDASSCGAPQDLLSASVRVPAHVDCPPMTLLCGGGVRRETRMDIKLWDYLALDVEMLSRVRAVRLSNRPADGLRSRMLLFALFETLVDLGAQGVRLPVWNSLVAPRATRLGLLRRSRKSRSASRTPCAAALRSQSGPGTTAPLAASSTPSCCRASSSS